MGVVALMVVESRVRVSSASHTDTDATRRLRAPRRPRIDGFSKISSAKTSYARFISDNPQKTTKFPRSYILDKVPHRFTAVDANIQHASIGKPGRILISMTFS